MRRGVGAVGIGVREGRLVETAEWGRGEAGGAFGGSLAVGRFDRAASGERVHIEDFRGAGLYPGRKYKASYGGIGPWVWLEAGEQAILEYTWRLVFNALIGNGDAHLKNWSLIYRDGPRRRVHPCDLGLRAHRGRPLALSLGDTGSSRASTSIASRALPKRAVCPCGWSSRRRATRDSADIVPAHEPVRPATSAPTIIA